MRGRPFVEVLAVVVLGAFAVACSDDGSGSTTTSSPSTEPTTTVAPTAPATTVLPTTVAPTTVPPSTLPGGLEQLAIWPAPTLAFPTPEAAASDFLVQMFGVGPVLGEFRQGDASSGEFEVFATADGAVVGNARSVLAMRQLGPQRAWFVLAAMSAGATITTPAASAVVRPGPLVVEGMATGFEATIVVEAFPAGKAALMLDSQVTMAGNLGELAPYSVTLDLSGAQPGDVVVILVCGGVGLETDPGDFAAIAVLIG